LKLLVEALENQWYDGLIWALGLFFAGNRKNERPRFR
jgi:hypothetical protein